MPHLPMPLDEYPADPRLREIFEEVRRTLGGTRVPQLFLALGLNPAVLRATFESYRATLLEGRVPVALKKLIGQTIAQMYDCPAAALVDSGASVTPLVLDGPGAASLPARERAVLTFARRVAIAPQALGDGDFEALRRLGLWDDEIFEILATTRLFVSFVGLCQSFGLSEAGSASAPQPEKVPVAVDDKLAALKRDDLLALTRRLRVESQVLTTRLTSLTEITLALTGTPVLSEIYQVLTDQAKWVIDFEQASICLLDESEGAYRLHTLIADCRDLTCEPVISSYETFDLTEGLPGRVITTGQPIITGNFRTHPEASPRLEERLADMGLSSALILPLYIGERVIGTLNFLAEAPDHYDDDDLRVSRLLGQQLSAALEAARLYTQVEDERSTLVAVVQSTADAVLVVDTNGQMLLANQAAIKLLGLDPASIAGMPLDAVVTLPALRALFGRVIGELQPVAADVAFPDDRTFRASLSPVQTAYGETTGYVAVLHDISHLVELDRMKSEFVATVSHDLKNPIQVIKLTTEMLPLFGALSQEQAALLERIERSAARMLALVTDLLDLGKIEAGFELWRGPCELGSLLTEALEDHRATAEAKRLRLSLGPPAPVEGLWVRGDAMRLKQVIANLLSNAIKYTPQGGAVSLEWKSEQQGAIQVCVHDTGYGIPADSLPHIFEKFYRVQDTPAGEVEGTGLGLAICRSIIEQHGGLITVASELGVGTSFCLTLPLYEPVEL